MDRAVRTALAGKPSGWFAPSYKLLSDIWHDLSSRLAAITTRKNEQEHWVELLGGGKLECWSLDNPDAGRGRAYARIVIDEAAIVANLESVWLQTLRPMLADYRGDAWFLSTPKGTANYFHTLYQRGVAGVDRWASWQRPTSTNPYIHPEELEDLRADLTELAFAQEVEARFVTWAGAVFRGIEAAAARPVVQEPAAIIGVDWGRIGDSTVFVAISPKGHVLQLDRFTGVEYALQRARLAAFWRRHGGRAWIVAESNSMGGPVVEQLQRDGLPVIGFWTSAPSKAAVIETLALAFERGEIAIPPDPVLMGELQAFEGKQSPRGMSYGAPEGVHDDCVMALAIGFAGLNAPHRRPGYLDPNTGDITAEPRTYQISPI